MIINAKNTFSEFDFFNLFTGPFGAGVDDDFAVDVFEEVDHFALSSSVLFLFFDGLFVVDVKGGVSVFEDAFASGDDGFDFGDEHFDGFVAGGFLVIVIVIELNFSEGFDEFFFDLLFADIGGRERFIVFLIVIDCFILNGNIACNGYSALS